MNALLDLSKKALVFVYLDDVKVIESKSNNDSDDPLFMAKIKVRRDVEPFSHTAGMYLSNTISSNELEPINHWQVIDQARLETILQSFDYSLPDFMQLSNKPKLAFDINLKHNNEDSLLNYDDFEIINGRSICDFNYFNVESKLNFLARDITSKLELILLRHKDEMVLNFMSRPAYPVGQYVNTNWMDDFNPNPFFSFWPNDNPLFD